MVNICYRQILHSVHFYAATGDHILPRVTGNSYNRPTLDAVQFFIALSNTCFPLRGKILTLFGVARGVLCRSTVPTNYTRTPAVDRTIGLKLRPLHPLLCSLRVQLTAQFTAVGGRNFLSELARREAKNEQFQFLKHTHALFSYFTRYGRTRLNMCVFVRCCLWSSLFLRSHGPGACIASIFLWYESCWDTWNADMRSHAFLTDKKEKAAGRVQDFFFVACLLNHRSFFFFSSLVCYGVILSLNALQSLLLTMLDACLFLFSAESDSSPLYWWN